jgi:hypothetical protein
MITTCIVIAVCVWLIMVFFLIAMIMDAKEENDE